MPVTPGLSPVDTPRGVIALLRRLLIVGGVLLALTIPQAALAWSYTVRWGDTLWLLSQRFGVPLASLRAANNQWSDWIYPGQVLWIPEQSNGGTSSLSPADQDLFARLVMAEAEGEPYAGMVAVAATVLNRVEDPRYPKTVRGVILDHTWGWYEYSPVADGRIWQVWPDDRAWRAISDALNGWDPSLGANGFYNPAKTTNWWVRSQPITTVIGNHVFYRA